MKKLMMVAAMALSAAVWADMSLADARGKIGEVVTDTSKMAEVISQLSAEDQVAFLSEVNAAIDKMPGSNDEKAAKFLDVNTAAMQNAQKGNLQALLAETFATVPCEALTIINESFAEKLFNRAADPSVSISDAEFTARAEETMKVIAERAAKTDETSVRTTFGILMFLRASNGSPADLREKLVSANLGDPRVKDIARREWIPAAMGDGVEKTYEPMLGAAQAGIMPDVEHVLMLGSSESLTALLSDLGSSDTRFAVATGDGLGNLGLPEGNNTIGSMDRIPRTDNKDAPWYGGYKRGEPGGYPYQEL